MIAQGHTAMFDHGVINGHPFFCTCGMGFDAFVSLKFAQSGKRGLATYTKMVLSEGMSYKPASYDVQVEDGNGEVSHCEAFLIACANAAQYGNNTYIAPGASMQDGLLDVIIIHPFKGMGGPKVLMDLMLKTVKDNHHVKHFHARSLHIHRQEEGAVHFDGDPMVMGCDIDIAIKPASLKAIVNPKAIEDKAKPGRVASMFSHLLDGRGHSQKEKK